MRPALIGLAALLGACSTSGTLIVQVRTDLAPERDFSAARAVLTSIADGTESSVSLDADATRDWGAGVRVAEVSDLPAGDYRARVSLVSSETLVVERPVRVTIEGGTHVVTVLLTRDCAGVTCPLDGGDLAAVACLGGRCVPEECTEESPELCPMPDCDSLTPCADPTAPCASSECTASGTCFVTATDGACRTGETCDPDTGCRAPPGTSCVDSVPRATEGLVALYTFDEGSGSVARDVSGVAPIMDLTFESDPSMFAWVPNGLELLGGRLAATPEATEQLTILLMGTNEVTAELWVRTSDLTQTGQILSLGRSATDRGFAAGQSGDRLTGFMRTTATDPTATMHVLGMCVGPQQRNPGVFTDTVTLKHVSMGFGFDTMLASTVFQSWTGTMLSRAGHAVDVCGYGAVNADFSPWTPASFSLGVGSELGSFPAWRGTVYQIAIFSRRLELDELRARQAACEGAF